DGEISQHGLSNQVSTITDHGLARATTAVGGAGAIPQCQCALLLKHQKAPSELDHAATDPGVAGSGEPLFAPARSRPASLLTRRIAPRLCGHALAVTAPHEPAYQLSRPQ